MIIGNWAVPTLLAHGGEAIQQRLVPPSLRGDITWCQMFSEPGAGSDLAALTTKAEKVEGGWRINGQKVWTSGAAGSDFAILLARTGREAAKHKGISYFVLDMTTPGIRSEEHTSELQSLMRNSYAVFCLQTKNNHNKHKYNKQY